MGPVSGRALNLMLAVQLTNGSRFSVVNTPSPMGNNFESDLLFGATSDSSGNVWFGGTFEANSGFEEAATGLTVEGPGGSTAQVRNMAPPAGAGASSVCGEREKKMSWVLDDIQS